MAYASKYASHVLPNRQWYFLMYRSYKLYSKQRGNNSKNLKQFQVVGIKKFSDMLVLLCNIYIVIAIQIPTGACENLPGLLANVRWLSRDWCDL